MWPTAKIGALSFNREPATSLDILVAVFGLSYIYGGVAFVVNAKSLSLSNAGHRGYH